MITYNGLDLFGSGPSVTQPGPLVSRDAVAENLGAIGASVIAQGMTPRIITQIGTLIADTRQQLRQLIDAIESEVGLSGATLIDEFENDWPECFMQSFEHEPSGQLGPRVTARYTITYLQACP